MINDYGNILLFQGQEAVGLEAVSDDGRLKVKLKKITFVNEAFDKHENYQSTYFVRDNVGQNWEQCNMFDKYNSLSEFVNGLSISSEFGTAYRLLKEQLKGIEI